MPEGQGLDPPWIIESLPIPLTETGRRECPEGRAVRGPWQASAVTATEQRRGAVLAVVVVWVAGDGEARLEGSPFLLLVPTLCVEAHFRDVPRPF